MTLTIGNWISAILVFVCCGVTAAFFAANDEPVQGTVAGAAAIILTIVLLIFCNWYNQNTANGARAYKDYKSNFSNGLEREITITAEDGREIFHYEGKVDIETRHEGNASYILFESEEGQRYIIYYGITDTVLIIEK